jgi:hypothetical protein
MNFFDISQHPSIAILELRIPGPLIPISLVALPLAVRPRTLKQYICSPFSKIYVECVLAALHLLLYTCMISEVLDKKDYIWDGVTLPLLEYTSLVIGETILKKSNFWMYTSTTVGWMLTLPKAPGSDALSRGTRAWILLVPSVSVALRTEQRLSAGANLSTLSLLTAVTSQIWFDFIASTRLWARDIPGLLLVPILLPICIATFCHTTRGKSSRKRFSSALPSWLRTAWYHSIRGHEMTQCIKCTEFLVAKLTWHCTGSFISSFLFTCLRWRWLLTGHSSSAPSWTVISSFVGFFCFTPILLLIRSIQLMRDRPRAANLEDFLQRQITDCFAALWWNTCIYLLLWVILEIMRVV